MNSEQKSKLKEAVHFLRLQRTEYEGIPDEQVMHRYHYDMGVIFQTIKPYLPDYATSFVDIGGGLGGMALLLAQHFGRECKAIVYDRTGDHGSKVGWHTSADQFGAYNSLQLTAEFLEGNQCENFSIGDADADLFPQGPHQLVISLLSMGFHYPVETYLKEIYESLAPGGVLICDIRKGTNGFQVAANLFGYSLPCGFYDKFERVAFRK